MQVQESSELQGSCTKTLRSEPLQISQKIHFKPRGLFRDKNLLHQKYVVERLSMKEIAKQIFSSRPTILRWLNKHGIEVRPSGSNIRRRNLAYGLQLKRREEVIATKEVANISKMKNLRDQGFSYWKIADIFSSMKIPTKTRKKKWQARTVQRILDDQNKHAGLLPNEDLTNNC